MKAHQKLESDEAQVNTLINRTITLCCPITFFEQRHAGVLDEF